MVRVETWTAQADISSEAVINKTGMEWIERMVMAPFERF
jgi:hypothetical protein